MANNVIVKEFFNWRSGNDSDLQLYLDGTNPWKLPILEEHIIEIKYAVVGIKSDSYPMGISGILIIHRIPTA
jgi:hypothetical protein